MRTWLTTSISRLRANGLRLQAEKEGRSVVKQLDWILRNAGIPELSDADLDKELKRLEKKQMEVAAN